MNTFKEKLKNSEYRNWVKGTLGLERTNRALFEYIKAKFALFTHRRAGPHDYFTEDVYNHIHLGSGCLRSNLKRKIKWDKTNDSWKWKNPCGKCEEAFKTILSMHTNPNKKEIHLENCENTTNVTLEWAIARFFMPKGNDKNMGPDDTDPAAMINLLLNCHLFTNQIRQRYLNELRGARNKLFHSSDNLVNDNVLSGYFYHMKGLLTDASNDTEVHDRIREGVAKEIKTIEQLEEAEISMTLFDDALKIKRKAIYEDYETCLQENDIEQLKVLLKLAENVAADLQFMNDHSEELKNVKIYMTKIEQLQTKDEELKIKLRNTNEVARHIKELHTELKHDVLSMKEEYRQFENSSIDEKFRLFEQNQNKIIDRVREHVTLLSSDLNQLQRIPNDISVLTRGIMRLKMGACFCWQSVRDEITRLDAEGMIIIVILTTGLTLLLRLWLYFV